MPDQTVRTVESAHPHQCLGCGYDLTGIAVDAMCPECGINVADSLPASLAPPISADTVVASPHPQPCFRCFYDLRGVPMLSPCPECGLPVADSLRTLKLHFADPRYLERLRSGLRLVRRSIQALTLTVVITLPAILLLVVFSPGLPGWLAIFFAGAASAIMLVAMCIGYIRITRQEAGLPTVERPTHSAAILQIASYALIALVAVSLAVLTIQLEWLPVEAYAVILLLAWMLLCVQAVAAMNCVRWYARRVPDVTLEGWCRKQRVLLPILFLFGISTPMMAGTFVAIFLYLRILGRLQKHLTSIEKTGVPAFVPGSFAQRDLTATT
ncbi:MAG: hypothetical protein HEQ23_16730 [Tepidisphaera sp.]